MGHRPHRGASHLDRAIFLNTTSNWSVSYLTWKLDIGLLFFLIIYGSGSATQIFFSLHKTRPGSLSAIAVSFSSSDGIWEVFYYCCTSTCYSFRASFIICGAVDDDTLSELWKMSVIRWISDILKSGVIGWYCMTALM